jgi:hypothetical protein
MTHEKWKLTRRHLLEAGVVGGAAVVLPGGFMLPKAWAQIAGGTLDPVDVDKYVLPLIKPPAMPGQSGKNKDKYKVGVRQFQQRILSPGHPKTTVWSYGSIDQNNSSPVEKRAGGRARQLLAPPVAGGPDPTLGKPPGWTRRQG